MATQASTPPPAVPIVKRDQDGKRIFDTNALEELIDAYCDNQSEAPYKVVSIIGAQNSGKSTLMNAMFNTQFQMLDQQKKGRKATTEGIWAAVCNNPRAIVFDIEGSDGLKHQDDVGFENQSALFALEISDVVFFNINVRDIGRMHAASIPLLRTSFQERLIHNLHMTKLVIAVRDYNKKTANADKLRGQILSSLDGICEKVNENKIRTSECFKTSVEFFPDLEREVEAFQQKCEDIIPKFFYQGGQTNWQVDDIPTLGENLWESIRKNERLNMPSYWAMVCRERCEVLKSGIITSLKDNVEYRSLTDLNNPSAFHAGLWNLLKNIKSEYDGKARNCEGEIATKVKQSLEEDILCKVEPIFRSIMERFMITLCVQAANEILKRCDEHFTHKKDHANFVVSYYIKMFNDETEGLPYNVEMYQTNFKRDIELIGKAVVKKAKTKSLRDIAIAISGVLTGGFIGGAAGFGAALTGGFSLSVLPAVITVFSKVEEEALDKSEAAYKHSVDKIVYKVLTEK